MKTLLVVISRSHHAGLSAAHPRRNMYLMDAQQEEGAHRLKGAVSPHPLHRKADRGMYVGFKLPAPEPGCEKVFGLCWRLVVASLPSVSIKQNEHGARMQAQ
eukprot:1160231-Pelagomonas_calceolata.AAC.1